MESYDVDGECDVNIPDNMDGWQRDEQSKDGWKRLEDEQLLQIKVEAYIRLRHGLELSAQLL